MQKILRLFLLVFFGGYPFCSYSFFEIVELMPNTLDDKNLEYIKIQNTSNEEKNLKNYYLEDASEKQYIFGENNLKPGEVQSFYRPETKLILNNSNEEIFLYNSGGLLIDTVSYESSNKGEAIVFGTGVLEEEVSGEEGSTGEEPGQESGTGEVVQSLEVLFSLQRPSYIFEGEMEGIYICDGEKDECKVNFDLRDSFSSEFPEKDYICEISFGSGIVKGEENKCNPNTIVFEKGEHEVRFRILDENTQKIIAEKTITLINSDEVFESHSSQYSNDITILRPNIIVQSGLDGEGKYFYCKKSDCKINLKYEKRHEDEECRWRFYPGQYESKTTRDRCNPGFVTFSEGIFELSLRVYQDGKESNYKKLKFYIYNTPETRNYLSEKEKKSKQKQVAWKKNTSPTGEGNTQFDETGEKIAIDIVLQGKIGKEKSLSGSMLECTGVKKCYVNLEGVVEGKEENITYKWLYNRVEFSREKNPKGLWLQQNSDIEFIALSGENIVAQKEFNVIFVASSSPGGGGLVGETEPLLFTENTEPEKTSKQPKIPFTQNFLVLKYDGLRISGKAPAESRVEIYQNGKNILSGNVDKKGKYRFVSKKFPVGNYEFDTKIILSSGEEIFLENSGKTEIISRDRIYWWSARNPSSTSQKTLKIPQLILQTQAADVSQDIGGEEDVSLVGKIFMSLIILLSILFAGGHLLLREISAIVPQKIFPIEIIQFSTRQKILLLIA